MPAGAADPAARQDQRAPAGADANAGPELIPGAYLMTPAEREYMQGIIDNMHSQFIHAVAEGRKLKDEDIRPVATGKVWTGSQAAALKLVDQIGDFQAALQDTAKTVGIKGEPTVVRPEKERRTLLDLMFADLSEWIPDRAKLMENHVGFYYLWK